MHNEETWKQVGSPLIEQDAEYLVELLARHHVGARIERVANPDDIDDGRTWIVTARGIHAGLAMRIRRNEFPEPAAAVEPEPEDLDSRKPKRHWGRALFVSGAGMMIGLRVGVKLRGGPVLTLLVGGALGLLAVGASVLFAGGAKTTVSDTAPTEASAEEGDEKGGASAKADEKTTESGETT
ncbi:MAG: hypothetical protein R3E76_13795 [Planctomycetota bacterium]